MRSIHAAGAATPVAAEVRVAVDVLSQPHISAVRVIQSSTVPRRNGLLGALTFRAATRAAVPLAPIDVKPAARRGAPAQEPPTVAFQKVSSHASAVRRSIRSKYKIGCRVGNAILLDNILRSLRDYVARRRLCRRSTSEAMHHPSKYPTSECVKVTSGRDMEVHGFCFNSSLQFETMLRTGPVPGRTALIRNR